MEDGGADVTIEVISDEDDEGFNKSLPCPVLPTRKMIDAHNVPHLPYASWCAACVRARGSRYAHKRIKDTAGADFIATQK